MEGKSQSMEQFKQLLLQEINLWLEILFHIDQANELENIISLQNYCFLYNVLSLTLENLSFSANYVTLPQMFFFGITYLQVIVFYCTIVVYLIFNPLKEILFYARSPACGMAQPCPPTAPCHAHSPPTPVFGHYRIRATGLLYYRLKAYTSVYMGINKTLLKV